MTSQYPTPEMKELFQAILAIRNEQEAAAFFRDLLTVPEITEFANRWQIVKLLLEEVPYLEISRRLDVSTTTVTRVAQWLNHGMDGYKTIASRLNYKTTK
jgi:TrpR-related protein YerC/YecD